MHLTAVERFTEWHETNEAPAQARHYSALLPATPPEEGEQYAFEVDLDACSGCKACVTACHTLNGLDEAETWRDVGLLHGGTAELPVLQHVTAACHHCLDPACMNVCPVKAYEKDPATGIVKHLDDQCIGCQYCMLACPYDVPKYNKQRGIVRKCDMCSSRLAIGEAPACVQACPNGAIRITVVRHQEVIENCETHQFLPAAPDPSITLPTTNYKTTRAFPRNMLPADYHSVRPEHAHWPLVFMLVLTQLSVGSFLVALGLDVWGSPELHASMGPVHSLSSVLFGLLAVGASVFHLGRPLYAFRAVIGLVTSWLSREILAFGIFAVLSTVYSAWVGFWPNQSGGLQRARHLLGTAVVIAGLGGVGCSVMIYQCTQRNFWNGGSTSTKFLLTTGMLGIATTLLASLVTAACIHGLTGARVLARSDLILLRGLIAVTAVKLLFEASFLRHLRVKHNAPSKRSALLLTGELARATKTRFALGVLGGIVLPGLLLLGGSPSVDSSLSGPLIGAVVLVLCAA
ncbi:MAG: dimethyl sulfoxide reductase anchor subunit [Planctomycetes bacterium]|nr:dimethyl sulfoxide reductase anchor subunit [Planctomycetota bacterium]